MAHRGGGHSGGHPHGPARQPRLNAREWPGPQPVRLTLDKNLALPPATTCSTARSPPSSTPTASGPTSPTSFTLLYPLRRPVPPPSPDLLPAVLADLYVRGIQSVLVEGGPTVLNALLDSNTWDEIRVFRGPKRLERGVAAPRLGLRGWHSHECVGLDDLFTYANEVGSANE
ncbi:MAG: dihydrofolate reductase family protein [Hymenobacter sp.]